MLAKRKKLRPELLEAKNIEISDKIEKWKLFQNAKVIFSYVSLPDEADTTKIIQEFLESKIFVVPVVMKKNAQKLNAYRINAWQELETKTFGILEPKIKEKPWPWKSIHLALIPGVAFDRNGNRIGYGKGFYDSILHKLTCPKVGLAFDFQLMDEIIPEKHDIPVDFVITDKAIIRCK